MGLIDALNVQNTQTTAQPQDQSGAQNNPSGGGLLGSLLPLLFISMLGGGGKSKSKGFLSYLMDQANYQTQLSDKRRESEALDRTQTRNNMMQDAVKAWITDGLVPSEEALSLVDGVFGVEGEGFSDMLGNTAMEQFFRKTVIPKLESVTGAGQSFKGDPTKVGSNRGLLDFIVGEKEAFANANLAKSALTRLGMQEAPEGVNVQEAYMTDPGGLLSSLQEQQVRVGKRKLAEQLAGYAGYANTMKGLTGGGGDGTGGGLTIDDTEINKVLKDITKLQGFPDVELFPDDPKEVQQRDFYTPAWKSILKGAPTIINTYAKTDEDRKRLCKTVADTYHMPMAQQMYFYKNTGVPMALDVDDPNTKEFLVKFAYDKIDYLNQQGKLDSDFENNYKQAKLLDLQANPPGRDGESMEGLPPVDSSTGDFLLDWALQFGSDTGLFFIAE